MNKAHQDLQTLIADEETWGRLSEGRQNRLIEQAIYDPDHPAKLLEAGTGLEQIVKSCQQTTAQRDGGAHDNTHAPGTDGDSDLKENITPRNQPASATALEAKEARKEALVSKALEDLKNPITIALYRSGGKVRNLILRTQQMVARHARKNSDHKLAANNESAREINFNEYVPPTATSSNATPGHAPAFTTGHAAADHEDLDAEATRPERIFIDLTGDSDNEIQPSNHYEEDLLAELDRTLCIQQSEAEEALSRKLTVSKFLLSDSTKKRMANLARQERNLHQQKRGAKNKKQKATLCRAEVNLDRKRKNLDERVRTELLQIQAKEEGENVQSTTPHLAESGARSGRRGQRPAQQIEHLVPGQKHAAVEQELTAHGPLNEQQVGQSPLPEFEIAQDTVDLLWQRRSEQLPQIIPTKKHLMKIQQICKAAAADPATQPSDPNQPRARAQIESAEKLIGYVFKDKNIIFEAILDYSSGVAKIGNWPIPDANMHLAIVGDSILSTLLREDGYHKERSRSTSSLRAPSGNAQSPFLLC